MKRTLSPGVLAALAAAAIGGAYAAESGDDGELAIGSAKISLTQAVAAAEQYVGGKASRAEYERHEGQWLFDVEVVRDGTVMDVRVDPASGKVLAATEDKAERGEEHGHED
jgi:uncharacterized membrane protein YkoI